MMIFQGISLHANGIFGAGKQSTLVANVTLIGGKVRAIIPEEPSQRTNFSGRSQRAKITMNLILTLLTILTAGAWKTFSSNGEEASCSIIYYNKICPILSTTLISRMVFNVKFNGFQSRFMESIVKSQFLIFYLRKIFYQESFLQVSAFQFVKYYSIFRKFTIPRKYLAISSVDVQVDFSSAFIIIIIYYLMIENFIIPTWGSLWFF